MNAHAQPVGGPLLTRGYKVLLGLGAIAFLIVIWRFAVGLGATTALSDGYPWGLWIAYDVVTGTALACGGYAMALLVYIFNRGKYHPLVRPAILTSALGYTIAGLSVVIDIGRPWYVWKVPLYFWEWNLNSALLEVALCIMAYVFVLWIEWSPAFFERYAESEYPRLRRLSRRALKFFDRALLWIVALGILLPTMHQSSLGSLILLTGPKLDPLYATPILPLLFLISCLAMGYAVVVFESTLSARAFRRERETPMLRVLGRAAAWGSVLFVGLRIGDLAVRGDIAQLARLDLVGVLFWLENALYLLPLLLLTRAAAPEARLFQGAMLLMLGGALYRFDAYLVAFDPGPGWSYFPAVPEQLVTIGFVALEIAVYVALVKRFPVLAGRPQTAAVAAR
jgi:Ni/Fe-hydrogenase subunit HybB-like protein